MDFSNLEEDKVVSHLVDNLQRQGLGQQLKFVQRTLLEAAYVKLGNNSRMWAELVGYLPWQ